MKKRILVVRSVLFVFSIIVFVLCGCATTPPSRFYTLSILDKARTADQTASSSPAVIVAVGPILIPDYLDKPEIVTRSGQNELIVNEYHRWAGSMESILSQAIMENLSLLLPSERFSVVRWVPGMQGNAAASYRLTLDVMKFDAVPRDSALFESAWTLSDRETGTILIRKSTAAEPIRGTDYSEMVAAMSKTIEKFTREVAETIKSRNNAPGL